MALAFIDSRTKRTREELVAIDLGSRTTKAVHLKRCPQGYALNGYAILDAPIFEKTPSPELLAEHLSAVHQALGNKTKAVSLAVGVNDAMVRSVDMPRIPVQDLRLVLKHNSKTYLQQDLAGNIFDCQIVNEDPAAPSKEAAPSGGGLQKQKVLVAGAKQQFLDSCVESAKGAGLLLEHIVPGLVGPLNALELTMPEVFNQEAIALVDLGFKSSSICLLQRGEFILSRVVALGGDRLTAAVSEAMNISYPEAEGIKIGMPQEVQQALESVLTPLGRELRASIDFFEHQQDKAVTHVFVTGGSARSELIVQELQTELMLECQAWDPTKALQIELPPPQATELEQVTPQLAVAVGAALAAL
jgi:type IV pilus assembly protein PilM